MAISILANHAHVFPASVNPQGTIDRLLNLLDACGIDEVVCFAPFAFQVDAGFDTNGWLAQEISKNPRLHGFGTIDLTRNDRKDQVRRAKDLGLRGLKLHPNVQAFDILCPEALEVYDAAQEQGLFITFHSGVHHYRIKNYHVLKFDEVAWNFPNLRFSLEHVGGYHFFADALAIIVNNIPFPAVPGRRCMVYAGLASVFTQDYLRFWYLPPERLRELVWQAGPEQLIFGLDFPYNLEKNTKIGIDTIKNLHLSEQQCAMILGNNLREAIGLLDAWLNAIAECMGVCHVSRNSGATIRLSHDGAPAAPVSGKCGLRRRPGTAEERPNASVLRSFFAISACYLLTIFGKNEQENLSAAERMQWRNFLEELRMRSIKRKAKSSVLAKKTNTRAPRLMQALAELKEARQTGDYSAITIRHVRISEPGRCGADAVRSLRRDLGLTQRLFAALMGVSVELIEHWELRSCFRTS